MEEELKSLKNPTRILTILMFLAVFITAIGAEGLTQLLPGVSPVVVAGIVGVAGYAVTQYGTEKRIVRAEEMKDQEYQEEFSDIVSVDDIDDIDDIDEIDGIEDIDEMIDDDT